MVHRRQVSQESDGDGYCGENESDHIVAPEVGWLPGNLAARSTGFQEYATGPRLGARDTRASSYRVEALSAPPVAANQGTYS